MTHALTLEELAEARAMREVPTLTDLVMKTAKRGGWKVFRARQGKASWNLGSGWPDLFLVRGGLIYVIELKAFSGKLSVAQEEWRALFREAEGENLGMWYYVWTPLEWFDGTVHEELE